MGQIADALRKAANVVQVKNCITQYENTGDGRHIWQAFIYLQQAGDPMPAEILEKLAQWGAGVLMAETSDEIAAALEMRGDSGSKKGLARAKAYTARWQIASDVLNLAERNPELSLSKAIELTAASLETTPATVRGIFYAIFPKPEPETQADANTLSDAMKAWR